MFYRKRIEKLENDYADLLKKHTGLVLDLDKKIKEIETNQSKTLSSIENVRSEMLSESQSVFETTTSMISSLDERLEKFSEKMNAGDASAYKNMIEQFLGTIKNMNDKYSDAMHSLISESARLTTFAMDMDSKKVSELAKLISEDDELDPPASGHTGNYGYENDKGHLGYKYHNDEFVTFYVNSQAIEGTKAEYSYGEIVQIATGFLPNNDLHDLQHIVTYGDSDDPERKSGTMKKEETIPVREGTYFRVTEV